MNLGSDNVAFPIGHVKNFFKYGLSIFILYERFNQEILLYLEYFKYQKLDLIKVLQFSYNIRNS